jgi:hypothetical protein
MRSVASTISRPSIIWTPWAFMVEQGWQDQQKAQPQAEPVSQAQQRRDSP